MGIKPIKKVNVGELVFQQLQDLLIQGEWKQGERLPSENELAEMFGVSRITVRQALQRLAAYGLLETRLGEGSFVKKVDVGDSMKALIPTMYLDNQSNFQVFEFREIIDSASAGLAAQRACGEDIQELEEILKDMVRCRDQEDFRAFAAKDLEFHFKICQITGNRLLIQTNSIVKQVLAQSMEAVIDRMGCEPALHYHSLLLDAIRRKDSQGAQALMKEHIGKNAGYFQEKSPGTDIQGE